MDQAPRGRVVAVAGGKGGVGKSIVSVNLAVAMTRLGADVVLLDADLGAPNVHTLFGHLSPGRTLADYLEDRVSDLAEVAIPSGVPKLRLICGGPSVLGAARTSSTSRQRLISQVGHLDTDCLLMDIGAGVDVNAIDFFNGADIRVIVVTPEVTSLQNAYGFLKIAVFRRMQQAVGGHRVAERLGEAFGGRAFEIGSSMDKMSTFFTLLEGEAPELSEPFRKLIRDLNVKLVGNMLARPNDRDVLFAMQRMIHSFLLLDTEIVGGLRLSHEVRASVNSGRPFALGLPREPNVAEMMKIARSVLGQDLTPLRKLRRAVSEAFFSDGGTGGIGSGELQAVNLSDGIAAEREGAATGAHSNPAALQRPAASAQNSTRDGSALRPPPVPASPAGARPAIVSPPVAHGPGVVTFHSPAAMPAAAATAEAFGNELAREQRSSDRMVVNHYVRLKLAGNWHLGAILEINLGGAELGGIRKSGVERAEGELSLIPMDPDLDPDDGLRVPVRILSANPDVPGGRIIVEFTDAAAATTLVEYFQSRRTD